MSGNAKYYFKKIKCLGVIWVLMPLKFAVVNCMFYLYLCVGFVGSIKASFIQVLDVIHDYPSPSETCYAVSMSTMKRFSDSKTEFKNPQCYFKEGNDRYKSKVRTITVYLKIPNFR